MKRIAIAVAALLATTLANAQIYQWKDENGKTVISDKPPIGAARTSRKIEAEAPPAPSAAPQKTTADREMDFRKRQQEAQEAGIGDLAAQDGAGFQEGVQGAEDSGLFHCLRKPYLGGFVKAWDSWAGSIEAGPLCPGPLAVGIFAAGALFASSPVYASTPWEA